MRQGILAVLALLVVFIALFVVIPLKVRMKVRVSLDGAEVNLSLKPPLVGRFISLPGVSRKGRAKGDSQDSGASVPAGGDLGGLGPELEALAEKVRLTVQTVRDFIPKIQEVVSRASCAITLERIHLAGHVSTGDAFQTALLAGGLNALFGLAFSVARKKGVRFTERPVGLMSPVYGRAHLDIRADIIVSASVWRLAGLGLCVQKLLRPKVIGAGNGAKGQTVEY